MKKEILDAIEELKTIKKIKTDSKDFIKLESYIISLNNGKSITRTKIIKGDSDGSAAIIFPITKDNKIVLAIEPRVFTKRTVGIDFPAGYINKGEEPIDAAKRELYEETGYTSNEFIHLGSYYQDQGSSAAYNHYYLAKDCIKSGEQELDDGEYVKYVLVDQDELHELFDKGYITGLNTAYAYEKGKKYIRRRD